VTPNEKRFKTVKEDQWSQKKERGGNMKGRLKYGNPPTKAEEKSDLKAYGRPNGRSPLPGKKDVI